MRLVTPGKTYFLLQSRTATSRWWPWKRWGPWGRHELTSIPGREPFAGRVAVLIDEGTFSTADNLAACLHDEHPDVTFVGRPTGAGTGAPRKVTLPASGATVRFCTMRVKSPSGSWIEGEGVTPDVPVQWTIADHLEGKDPDLTAALRR